MDTDLIVERRYVEQGAARVERITWRHVPPPVPLMRWVTRRFRGPKLVMVAQLNPLDVGKGRPLPEWCAPEMAPNLWIWVSATSHAADVAAIVPDQLDSDGTAHHSPGSSYWDYYALPLRRGVTLSA